MPLPLDALPAAAPLDALPDAPVVAPLDALPDVPSLVDAMLNSLAFVHAARSVEVADVLSRPARSVRRGGRVFSASESSAAFAGTAADSGDAGCQCGQHTARVLKLRTPLRL